VPNRQRLNARAEMLLLSKGEERGAYFSKFILLISLLPFLSLFI
jgi:hypothetical protein